MTDLFLLSRVQMRRIERYFPLSHWIARVDDRRIVSAIVFVIKNRLRWRDAPRDYGPHKTIYNRFVRWSRLAVFNKIFAELAGTLTAQVRALQSAAKVSDESPEGAPLGDRFAGEEPVAITAVPFTARRAAAFSPPCIRQRFLPVAAAFRQSVPARVRAKHRGAKRKGKGSRVNRSIGLSSSFISYPSLGPLG
jgi:transposase